MAELGITVLKNNVPWGPFTRVQIDEGLARGDFTVKSLAHAAGLPEWQPLGEVLDYVAQSQAPFLPPVPAARELPPLPPRPPILPPKLPPVAARPSPPPPPLPPVLERQEVFDVNAPALTFVPASFFLRGIAFLIDAGILFVPLLLLYLLGALAIEIPGAIHHISHQARMEEWDSLQQNMWRLAWLVTIGFGWIYGAGLESSRAQATYGKRWMGIKVTDAQGERIDFLRATGRYAAKYLSALPCFLGFIMAILSSRGLAWHDRLSETRVVKS